MLFDEDGIFFNGFKIFSLTCAFIIVVCSFFFILVGHCLLYCVCFFSLVSRLILIIDFIVFFLGESSFGNLVVNAGVDHEHVTEVSIAFVVVTM